MKYAIIGTLVLTLLLTGGSLYFINTKLSPLNKQFTQKEVDGAAGMMETKIKGISADITKKVTGFSQAVSNNQNFAMKLIIERDLSAGVITDIAGSYIKAMNLDFLVIMDDKGLILSSGHFPANSGNKGTVQELLDVDKPKFIHDMYHGNKVLSLQVKKEFTCADQKLYCVGGIFIDDNFLSAIRPDNSYNLFIRDGESIIGSDIKIESMSKLKQGDIIVNNKKWIAVKVPLLSDKKGGGILELFIMKASPESFSLLNLF